MSSAYDSPPPADPPPNAALASKAKMPLCLMCRLIPDDFAEAFSKRGWEQLYIHHPSLASLKRSAKSGCMVCLFLLNSLNGQEPTQEYPCEEPTLYGIRVEPERVGPRENVASSERHQPMFSVLCHNGDFRMAYKFGMRGSYSFFSIVNMQSSNRFRLLPLHQSNFTLASLWINQCSESHQSCEVRYDAVFIPTRLIDVGHKGRAPHLIESRASGLKNSKYFALSHCWGPSMPESATTTKSMLTKRLTEIPLRTLPRTFRDAIIATRRMGVKYLWIDSLCIIQDSSEDWQHESALMGKVYSHCYCMLAAASSKDCHGGLFPSQNDLPILGVKGKLQLLKPMMENFSPRTLLQKSPLNLRGWTLQEWELSPKVLYFTTYVAFFECREAFGHRKLSDPLQLDLSGHQEGALINKSLVRSISATRCLDPVMKGTKKLGPSDFQLSSVIRYENWRGVVEGYSQRRLTKMTDRFPALSGLASEYAYLLDDQYVAGLWRNDLIKGLCWRASDIYKPNQRVVEYAPSWSWAKVNGFISYDWLYDPHPTVKWPSVGWGQVNILSVETDPEGTDPNGTLLSAQIHLIGYVFPIHKAKTGEFKLQGQNLSITWDWEPPKHSTLSVLKLGRSNLGIVMDDVLPDRPDEKVMKYQRLGLASLAGCDLEPLASVRDREIILV